MYIHNRLQNNNHAGLLIIILIAYKKSPVKIENHKNKRLKKTHFLGELKQVSL